MPVPLTTGAAGDRLDLQDAWQLLGSEAPRRGRRLVVERAAFLGTRRGGRWCWVRGSGSCRRCRGAGSALEATDISPRPRSPGWAPVHGHHKQTGSRRPRKQAREVRLLSPQGPLQPDRHGSPCSKRCSPPYLGSDSPNGRRGGTGRAACRLAAVPYRSSSVPAARRRRRPLWPVCGEVAIDRRGADGEGAGDLRHRVGAAVVEGPGDRELLRGHDSEPSSQTSGRPGQGEARLGPFHAGRVPVARRQP